MHPDAITCCAAIQDLFNRRPQKYKMLAHAESHGKPIVYVYSESKGYNKLPLWKREEYNRAIEDRLAEIQQQYPKIRIVIG
jgi:hypothetical protein